MWSDSFGETSYAGLTAHSRWLPTMAHNSLASRSPPFSRNTTFAHKQCPSGDAGYARNFLREISSPLKKRPKGDARCARSFFKGGRHAPCGKYPGSYPFPKGGRIVTQLPIRSQEAFWELTGFGVVRTPKLSELEAGAIPGWVTTLGSCSVSSQKQNRASSEGGPKRTISCYGGAGPGCDNLVSEPLCRVVRMCRRGRRTP
ncbi:hypothetical protein L3X38_003229 [Prunus dulcis]|uniref:Uncharacterized protein n=1 Tax=Prunus dulcis TaxID=3755 RepID=A0AAD4ZLN0_PRUDU|nr:hypothetical protein L3X38_003229 [Prunus dulcis]